MKRNFPDKGLLRFCDKVGHFFAGSKNMNKKGPGIIKMSNRNVKNVINCSLNSS